MDGIMGIEYRIEFAVPENYAPDVFLRHLPSPISRPKMYEIYSYAIEPWGFYFIDHVVDQETSSLALRLFLDEALAVSDSVRISTL